MLCSSCVTPAASAAPLLRNKRNHPRRSLLVASVFSSSSIYRPDSRLSFFAASWAFSRPSPLHWRSRLSTMPAPSSYLPAVLVAHIAYVRSERKKLNRKAVYALAAVSGVASQALHGKQSVGTSDREYPAVSSALYTMAHVTHMAG